MRRKLLVLTAALATLLAFAPGASAARRTITLQDITVNVAFIRQAGDAAVYAGSVSGSPFGPGATVVTARNIEGNRFAVTGRVFYARGTLRIAFTNVAEPQPDGSVRFTSTDGRILGGTGRFRRARGRFTFNGTAPDAGAPQTHELNGRVSVLV